MPTAKKATASKPTAKPVTNPELELFLEKVEEAKKAVKDTLSLHDTNPSTVQYYTRDTLKKVIGASKWA